MKQVEELKAQKAEHEEILRGKLADEENAA